MAPAGSLCARTASAVAEDATGHIETAPRHTRHPTSIEPAFRAGRCRRFVVQSSRCDVNASARLVRLGAFESRWTGKDLDPIALVYYYRDTAQWPIGVVWRLLLCAIRTRLGAD